jgi:VTC domain-containing protein
MIAGHLADMAPIGLAELTEHAELQTRVDRKYILPLAQVELLLPEIGRGSRALDIDGLRLFRYRSVYFDTPDLTSFHLAVRRRRRRFKVRTRTYLDSRQCWLEIKTEGHRGGTVKSRLPYRCDDHDDVAPGRGFIDAVLADLTMADHSALTLAPVLLTHYLRGTLYLPATRSRVTIDVDLSWMDSRNAALALPHVAIVETKTGAAASEADRLLWSYGHRPVSVSKYATGLAALRPELPAAPWRRTLRRHFTVTDARVPAHPLRRA